MIFFQQVPNVLPSVSAAIGYDSCTNIVWFIFILTHAPFRFKLAKALDDTYKNLFKSFKSSKLLAGNEENKYSNFNRQLKSMNVFYFSHLFNKIEITGLIILTIFTSNSSYGNFSKIH